MRAGSWVIVSRDTGLPVVELFDERIVQRINTERYEVLTALEWLQRLNHQIKSSDTLR